MPALNLLLIDDSEQDAARVSDTLSRAGYVVNMSRVQSVDGLVEQLAARRFDVVVAEYALPGFRGARALSLVREHAGDLPFIFVSRAGGEDAIVQAMRLGAQDYIRKENLA
jgi:DNA-binding NtrC family response regulator